MSCTICEIEEIKCEFAAVMNSIVNELNFGITSCCKEDFDRIDVKFRLSEFSMIQDSDTDFILITQPMLISPVSFGDCCK